MARSDLQFKSRSASQRERIPHFGKIDRHTVTSMVKQGEFRLLGASQRSRLKGRRSTNSMLAKDPCLKHGIYSHRHDLFHFPGSPGPPPLLK
jgi:hypothetical protein